jgi:hypothetical protein
MPTTAGEKDFARENDGKDVLDCPFLHSEGLADQAPGPLLPSLCLPSLTLAVFLIFYSLFKYRLAYSTTL